MDLQCHGLLLHIYYQIIKLWQQISFKGDFSEKVILLWLTHKY